MFTKCLLLLTAATSLAARSMPESPWDHLRSGLIIGGSDTSIEEVPWQVSLQVRGGHVCGGSIYNEKIIITAAHCVTSTNPGKYKVRAGTNNWKKGGQVVQVAKIKTHENSIGLSNDVAVLRLRKNLKLDGKKMRPIELASETPAHNVSAIVSGWGRTLTSNSPIILQSVNVSIVSREACRIPYGDKITDDMICAASPGKDSCQGDSGGPLVANNKLVGIVSWGFGCADPDFPGVYADVAVLRDWIEHAVKELK